MALTFTVQTRANFGSENAKIYLATPDASYPNTGTYSTSGYAVSKNTMGLLINPKFMSFELLNNATLTGYLWGFYDRTNGNIHFIWCAGAGAPGTEVANGTDLHLYSGYVLVVGE